MAVFDLLFGFKGRIPRSQFWLGQIALIGGVVIIFLIWGLGVAGTMGPNFKSLPQHQQNQATASMIMGLVGAGFFALVLTLWIGNALAVKRLHDRGKSGWWSLIYIVPGIIHFIAPITPFTLLLAAANIWYFVELGFLKGDQGANAYGPVPESDAGALVSREIAELQVQAASTRPVRSAAGLADLPGKPAGVVKPRTPRTAGAEKPTGFGRRASRIA